MTDPVTDPTAEPAPADELVGPVQATGVVVGADGSASSSSAVLWAADAAAAHDLPLTVVHSRPDAAGHVVELDRGGDTGVGGSAGSDTVLDDAAAVAAQHRPGLAVREVQFPEAPVQSLLAASETAEIVVIGSRGLEGFKGLLVGSTTMHVVPYASCPVVVVRPSDQPDQSEPADSLAPAPHAGAVVLGYDGSVSANRAAAFAFRHADATGASVVVVTAKRDGPEELTDVDPNAALPGSDTASFHAAVILVADAHPRVPVSFQSGGGHPAQTLLEASEGAALLVVGSRGRGGFAGLVLGSVSQKVLAHARCPVAFVPARVSAAVAGGV